MNQTPIRVKADRSLGNLAIEWRDGHLTVITYDTLRTVCPCVTCKGGHEHMGGPPEVEDLTNPPNLGVILDDIEQLGTYAVQLKWNDGHSTGIYTWDYLRACCSCNECRVDLIH